MIMKCTPLTKFPFCFMDIREDIYSYKYTFLIMGISPPMIFGEMFSYPIIRGMDKSNDWKDFMGWEYFNKLVLEYYESGNFFSKYNSIRGIFYYLKNYKNFSSSIVKEFFDHEKNPLYKNEGERDEWMDLYFFHHIIDDLSISWYGEKEEGYESNVF